MRVAFLTSQALPDLYDDDRLAVAALAQRGVTVAPVRWDTASVEALGAFDGVVMRSPWDWFRRRPEFRAFVASLGQVRCPVLNAPGVLQAFADKGYLARLQAKGASVVPTVTLDSLAQVPGALAAQGWPEAVLKPAFTANAFDAHRFRANDVHDVVARAATLPQGEQWLLQPFLPGVAQGELSFVFFGDEFSHAVRKVPRADDWRVQHEHGGVPQAFTPDEGLVAQARALLQAAVRGTTYARVDGVLAAGRLVLMELELVEPELFFRFSPDAPARFADAVVAALRQP